MNMGLDMGNDVDHLNLSWTQEFLQSIHSDSIPSTEHPSSIKVLFLYVSSDSVLEKVDTVDHTLNQTRVDEMQLLQWIEDRKTIGKKQYRFYDLLSFLVDLDSTQLTQSSLESKGWYKSWGIPQNISLPSTFSMLHSVNRLWIVFREVVCIQTLNRSVTPVSILKQSDGLKRSGGGFAQTKKRVRLILPEEMKHSKTAKNR